jgi:hypothetical protein
MSVSCTESRREYQRQWRAKNPDKVRAYRRQWRANNVEELREYNRVWRKNNPEKVKSYSLKYLYGITLEQKVLMHEQQNGKCLFCQKDFNCSDLVVDHCHVTKEVRSLLCNSCNTGFGLFYENPETLRRAADFVEKRLAASKG